jgi:hypothetical protein
MYTIKISRSRWLFEIGHLDNRGIWHVNSCYFYPKRRQAYEKRNELNRNPPNKYCRLCQTEEYRKGLCRFHYRKCYENRDPFKLISKKCKWCDCHHGREFTCEGERSQDMIDRLAYHRFLFFR